MGGRPKGSLIRTYMIQSFLEELSLKLCKANWKAAADVGINYSKAELI